MLETETRQDLDPNAFTEEGKDLATAIEDELANWNRPVQGVEWGGGGTNVEGTHHKIKVKINVADGTPPNETIDQIITELQEKVDGIDGWRVSRHYLSTSVSNPIEPEFEPLSISITLEK